MQTIHICNTSHFKAGCKLSAPDSWWIGIGELLCFFWLTRDRPYACSKKKNNGLTIVHNDTLLFLSAAGTALQVDHSLSLTAFLEDDTQAANIPPAVLNRINRLLIVPDYWIGQADLSLQSRKRSIVEAFVERKLTAEHTDLPDIGLFYGYSLATHPSEEDRIHTFFLQ